MCSGPQYDSLQLCDYKTGCGSVRCSSYKDSCIGSGYRICYPHVVWSATLKSEGVYIAPELTSGLINPYLSCGVGYCSTSIAFSVRFAQGFSLNMRLCDFQPAGSVRCDSQANGCAGSGTCYPNVVWGGITQNGKPFTVHFGNGSLGLSVNYDKPQAFSVRCLLLAFNGHAFLLFASLLSPSAAVRFLELIYFRAAGNLIKRLNKSWFTAVRQI